MIVCALCNVSIFYSGKINKTKYIPGVISKGMNCCSNSSMFSSVMGRRDRVPYPRRQKKIIRLCVE